MSVAVRTGVSRPTVARSLDGVPIHENPYGMMVEPFCAPPPVDLTCHQVGNALVLAVNWGDAVGIPSARNLVMAESWRPFFRKRRAADDPRTRSGVTHGISVPTRTYFFDLLLHQDVYRGCTPTMNVMELGESGSADPNDPSREFDILDVAEKLEAFGSGIQRFRTDDLPGYVDLLAYACDKMGWRPQEMRAYRARIEYPIFGTQVRASFDVPVT